MWPRIIKLVGHFWIAFKILQEIIKIKLRKITKKELYLTRNPLKKKKKKFPVFIKLWKQE